MGRGKHLVKKQCLVLLIVLCATSASARNYFVSPNGDDNSDGDLSRPWKSIEKINSTDILPGDGIFFEGGQTFHGGLKVHVQKFGSQNAPVVITSYGEGRATLRPRDEHGIFIYNSAGIIIQNLHIIGYRCDSEKPDPLGCSTHSQCQYSNGSGIYLLNDLPLTEKLSGFNLSHLEIEGFGDKPDTGNPSEASGPEGYGIYFSTLPLHREFEAPNKSRGFDHIRITNTVVHDNQKGGIVFIGLWPQKTYQDIYISHTRAYNQTAIPHLRTHTGSGILISAAFGATVEHTETDHNGCLNYAVGGPVGLWAFNSSRVLFQKNESHHNRTLSVDGGGFDFDGGVTDSVMQDNVSHHNDGPGYLLAQFPGAPPFNNITIQNNVSMYDSQGTDGAGIFIWAKVHDSVFKNNTVYVKPKAGFRPAGVRFLDWIGSNVGFYNNVFQVAGGIPILDVTDGPGLVFKGNKYSSSLGKFEIRWNGESYSSLASWRKASNQEK